VHLVLRPRVWSHCASTGQEVSGVLQPSHICIRRYTYKLTARGVYVVRYPTLLEWTSRPQAHQAIETRRGRVCRTKGGERGGIERLVPVDYTARPSRCFFLNVLNPSMHADILPHRSVQPRAVGLGQT